MPAEIVSGLDLATDMAAALRARAKAFAVKRGRPPHLARLALADTGAVAAYLDRQDRLAESAGITTSTHALTGEVETRRAVGLLRELSDENGVDGILVLQPLPDRVDGAALAQAIDPSRDVDGMSPAQAGRVALGMPGFAPCTAVAARRLAERLAGPLRGKECTVVGATGSVGRALGTVLLQAGATLRLTHIDTRDLARHTRAAEVLFVAAGRAGLVSGEMIAEGALVIDIGINPVTDKDGRRVILGDVELEGALARAAMITAVPEGVGPVTTSVLLEHTMAAAEAQS